MSDLSFAVDNRRTQMCTTQIGREDELRITNLWSLVQFI